MSSPSSAGLDAKMERLVAELRRLDRLAGVKGCSEEDISSAERALGTALPRTYRAFLRHLGWRQGVLLRGTDVAGASELPGFQADARHAVSEWQPAVAIPAHAIVIAMHQGYRILYVLPEGGDGPVFEVREGESGRRVVASTFWDFIEEELATLKAAIAAQRHGGMA